MLKMLCIWLDCYANFHPCIYGLVPSLLHSTHTHTDNQIRIILESTKLIGICPLTFIFKQQTNNIIFGIDFSVCLRNRLISDGLETVLSHTERSCIASYYRQFPTNIKI